MASTNGEQLFQSAVKIITGLPKDGAFQPSNDMKLRFYGLYKQATLGPCTSAQPAFWDVVNRAKWTAWKALGDMSKEDAMRGYVEELKQVVETMTLDENIQDFLHKLGPMYEFVTDDGRVISQTAEIGPPAVSVKSATGRPLVNGGHSTGLSKNGATANGIVSGSANGNWSDDSEEGAQVDRNQQNQLNHSSAGATGEYEADLETLSDDEKFDDASDNQAFASAAVGVAVPEKYGIISRPSASATVVTKTGLGDPDGDNTRSAHSTRANRHAAMALGHQLPETATAHTGSSSSATAIANTGESIFQSWILLRQMHSDRVQRDDDWLRHWLKRKKLKPGRNSHRKHRGGEQNGKNGSGPGNGGAQDNGSPSQNQPGQPLPTGGSPAGHRTPRTLSGESGSSSNSSVTDSASLDFDPYVSVVLLRMHRELQHVNRQLELVEDILVTQQQMIQNLLVNCNQMQQQNTRLFSNLPWRTIAFIVAWPVLVNVLIRLFAFKLRRRK